MILKICSELPDMYIMIAFIGSAFAGARAISHDFLIFKVSVSSVVGAFRGTTFEEPARCHNCQRSTIECLDRHASLFPRWSQSSPVDWRRIRRFWMQALEDCAGRPPTSEGPAHLSSSPLSPFGMLEVTKSCCERKRGGIRGIIQAGMRRGGLGTVSPIKASFTIAFVPSTE